MDKVHLGFVVAVITLLTFAVLGITLGPRPENPNKTMLVPQTQVVLDCNRPNGREVWKVDSITFHKDLQLTLKTGDANYAVDASDGLCVIDSRILEQE